MNPPCTVEIVKTDTLMIWKIRQGGPFEYGAEKFPDDVPVFHLFEKKPSLY